MDYLGIYRRLEYKATSGFLREKNFSQLSNNVIKLSFFTCRCFNDKIPFIKQKNLESYDTCILFRKKDQISDVHINLEMLMATYSPCVIFVDAGISNTRKCHIYLNELHQLSMTIY